MGDNFQPGLGQIKNLARFCHTQFLIAELMTTVARTGFMLHYLIRMFDLPKGSALMAMLASLFALLLSGKSRLLLITIT